MQVARETGTRRLRMQNAMQDASKCDANAYVIADANATNRKRPTGDFGIPYWLDAGPERIESAKLRRCWCWYWW